MGTGRGWTTSFGPVPSIPAAPDVDVYAELTLDGGAPAARFPGVAAHLESCAECREDVEGLIAALRDTADRDPWPDSSGPARGR